MFAIIKTGGKQYKVAANDVIMIEKLAGASGDLIEFTDVLMMSDGNSIKVGAPLVSKATVCGTVLDQIRGDKVIVFKKKKRHNYRRKNGHRQDLTVVRITDILADGTQKKAKPAEAKGEGKAKAPVKTEAPEAQEKPVAKKAASKDEKPAVKKEAAKPKKATKKVGE